MFLKYCKKCLACCGSDGYVDILMSKDDIAKIPKRIIKKAGSLYKFRPSRTSACHFLSAKGCKLAYRKRPLDCRLYPFTFALNKEGVRLMVFRDCPHYRQLTKKNIEKTRQELVRSINKWSKKEIAAYAGQKNAWAWITPEKLNQ